MNYFFNYLKKPRRIRHLKKIEVFECKTSDIEVIVSSTNTLLKIFKDKPLFFRECRPHLGKKEYIAHLIEDYYDLFSLGPKEDKQYLMKCFENKDNVKKFFSMGFVANPESNVYKFFKTEKPELIGLNETNHDVLERIKRFILFSWGEVISYINNSFIGTGAYQSFNSCRQLSTVAVANLLKIGELVPKTRYVKMVIDGRFTKIGTLTDGIDGEIPYDLSVEKRKALVSPELLKKLTALNVLDTITGEKDHRPGNYMVTFENNAIGIKAFDNDSPSCFAYSSAVFKTYAGSSSVINAKGHYDRPYIDCFLLETIVSLNCRRIVLATLPFLNWLQLFFLVRRFSRVKKALITLKRSNSESIIKGVPSELDLTKDLSGKYGKTYLQLFLEDVLINDQPWLECLND